MRFERLLQTRPPPNCCRNYTCYVKRSYRVPAVRLEGLEDFSYFYRLVASEAQDVFSIQQNPPEFSQKRRSLFPAFGASVACAFAF